MEKERIIYISTCATNREDFCILEDGSQFRAFEMVEFLTSKEAKEINFEVLELSLEYSGIDLNNGVLKTFESVSECIEFGWDGSDYGKEVFNALWKELLKE